MGCAVGNFVVWVNIFDESVRAFHCCHVCNCGNGSVYVCDVGVCYDCEACCVQVCDHGS